MSLGHEIGNLIEGANDEIDELHFADGAQAAVAHPASRADNGALADGRVDHALPTKALQQPFAGLECPAVHAHVARILWQSSPVQYTPVSAISGGGIGEFSANSRSVASRALIFSSISFLSLASSSFSLVRNFS